MSCSGAEVDALSRLSASYSQSAKSRITTLTKMEQAALNQQYFDQNSTLKIIEHADKYCRFSSSVVTLPRPNVDNRSLMLIVSYGKLWQASGSQLSGMIKFWKQNPKYKTFNTS